jgi:pilus assembly protein CpaE
MTGQAIIDFDVASDSLETTVDFGDAGDQDADFDSQAYFNNESAGVGHGSYGARAYPPESSAFADEDDHRLNEQPVPRISIEAFCELPETASTLQRAAADRRMGRAHVTVQDGGLTRAIQKFHSETTPNLIIIETGLRGRELFSQLEELSNVCDVETRVIVIGAANDITLYRELMRRGVSEYLVPPFTPVQLMRVIADLFHDPDQPFAGKTVAFIGAKGGVGASTVAHNVAWSIAENVGRDTSIVDLDISFGTASLDFNQEGVTGITEALNNPDRVDTVLLDRLVTRCTDRLTMFTAPANLDREWELDPRTVDTVIDAIRRTVPMVVLDLPHIWQSWTKQLLLSADEVVIIATPELASLRNAKNMHDLVVNARPNDIPPRIVLNMVGVPKRPEISVSEFADAMQAQPALVLPFEPFLFGTASTNGQMLGEIKAESKPAVSMRHLASLLTGQDASPRSKNLLKKLLKRA